MSQPNGPTGAENPFLLPSSIARCLDALYVPDTYTVLAAQVAPRNMAPSGADVAIWALISHCDSAGRASFMLALTEWLMLQKTMIRATEYWTGSRLPSGEYLLSNHGEIDPRSVLSRRIEEDISGFRLI